MPRVCAVSYLNTVPLVWGMLHGSSPEEGHGVFDLRFALPSECADQIASGEADIGIVPVIEMARQKLEYLPGTGIACHGPVRSILLISKVPIREIKTLATDSGSRTSVQLARVILAEKFGLALNRAPKLISRVADLASMLGEADAGLLIGDAALRIDPEKLPFETLDLGAEWVAMTGLPMVFAVWAGREEIVRPEYAAAFTNSLRFGVAHMDEIVKSESPARGFGEAMVRKYLTEHIVFELGDRDYAGMQTYLDHVKRLERQAVTA
jgi:chorismate dehydratase